MKPKGQKPMLSVSELAKATGLHANTIRHADRRGLVTAKRDVNGYRLFSADAVKILRRLYLRDEHAEGQRDGHPAR